MEKLIKHHGIGVYSIISEDAVSDKEVEELFPINTVECVIQNLDKTYVCVDHGVLPTIWEKMYFEEDDRKEMFERVSTSGNEVFKNRINELFRIYEEMS